MAIPATVKGPANSPAAVPTVESRASWMAAGVVLFIFTFSYGAPLIAPVALKAIAADLGSTRSVPALANALAWLGSGAGAMAFGWIAERFGIRGTAVFGAVMIGAGLVLASQGGTWELLIGHGVLVGLLGGGATNVPLIVYISRWFDRRRGSAIALISCGQYIAGILWPPLIALGIEHLGWRPTMWMFGVASGTCMVLAALLFLRPVPDSVRAIDEGDAHRAPALAMSPRLVFALLCIAGFFCCVPMAMPPAHLVALCSDLGIGPARGALMLSTLLGSAFVSRLFWGWLSDRAGGLYTILAASICQAAALGGVHPDPGRGGAVCGVGRLRCGVQRYHPRLRRGAAPDLSCRRSLLAGARLVLRQHLRHGARRMARGRHVRPVRLLRARIRGWCRVQRGEHCVDRMVGNTAPMTMVVASHVHPTG